MFTKCDLVAGFTEFFEDLGRGDREQVWGVTFPYSDDASASPAGQFGAEFDRLIRRLNERLISRISQERDVRRRGLIHGFPKQMSSLRDGFTSFVGEVFQSSRYETSPLLRGVYFTSGTQEGTPIDRLMSVLAKTFRIDAQALPPQTAAGKSFFIADVLRKIAFAEAGLAGTNRRFELQRAWLQKGAYVGVMRARCVGRHCLGVRLFPQSRASSSGSGRKRARPAKRSPQSTIATTIRCRCLPALDAVRQLPGGYADRERGGSWFGDFGLSQQDKIGDAAVATYRRLLNQLFLSRIMLRLEDQLQRGGPTPDYTYEALKAYLMLDSREHYDADAIKAFVQLDWDTNLQRQVSTEQRQALAAHLKATFEERPLPLPLPLDDAVVAQARRDVRAIPLEDRIYGRLRRTFQGDVPGFNIRDAAGGATAELVFVRKSGAPLAQALPPLFTKQAYQQVFVAKSRELTSELAGESWILGDQQTIDAAEQERLLARVRERYLDEFARLYSDAILDVGLAPFNTPEEAARIFNILSRPEDSPLLLLLQEISRQTSLDKVDDKGGLAAQVGGKVTQLQEQLKQVIGAAGQAPQSLTDALVRNGVEQRFRALNALVQPAADGKPRPVDHLLDLMRQLYQYMSVVASEAAGGAIPPQVQQQGQAVLQQFRAEAPAQPNMLVGDLLQTAAARTAALTTGGLRAYLNDLWQSGPLQVCRQAIANRYPIVRGSEQTIRLDDFGAFFGYGGQMDRFFNEHLRQYVDATSLAVAHAADRQRADPALASGAAGVRERRRHQTDVLPAGQHDAVRFLRPAAARNGPGSQPVPTVARRQGGGLRIRTADLDADAVARSRAGHRGAARVP